MIKVDKVLAEEKVGRDKIQIFSGNLTPEKWRDFIKSWSFSGMPYGIIETLNKIEFKKNFNKYSSLDPVRVRRLRIFGESGDLDIRQDHSVLYWRYVGRGDLSPQILEDNETEDFWVQKMNVNKKFFQEEKEAFLWGKYKEEKAGQSLWHENRVAKAKLAYPVDKKPQQVKICYKLLSENGQVAFIWLTGLKGG